MLDIKSWSTNWGGRELVVETGHLALQTQASVTVRLGDTVVLATAVQSTQKKEGIDFFPLFVEYEERLYAAGKIKGSRFIKREGRPSDNAILTGRIVDRAIRPLFNQSLQNDVQIVITVLSIDGENDTAVCSLLAASTALAMSPIIWNGPISAARVGRVNGEFVLNMGTEKLDELGSDLNLMVAGTSDRIIMVEAGAKQISEEVMYKAMQWAGEQMKPAFDLIEKIVSEVGEEKYVLDNVDENAPQIQAKKLVEEFVSSVTDTMIFDRNRFGRKERNEMVDAIKAGAKAKLLESGIEEEYWGGGLSQIKEFVAREVTKRILEKEQRLDGRAITDIRELQSEIDLLPRTHGSAMFMRGDTQVLSVVTLGAPGDVQTMDSMEEDGKKRYMHHYNDAPYTYGETGFMRGPGRRAIGHGALAERAIEPVLPTEEDFPYAIRVVSEVMGSNGSSSMASTCGSTLSLMAAGVPITKPVAGIAMGLASSLEDPTKWKVLTDLQDIEDGPGGMDFKITGTEDGITAMQMDTKTAGLSWDIVKQTLDQSKTARVQVLANMASAISVVAEMSQYAPRIVTITIDPEKIRDVIGTGGKVINGIIDETGVTIDIEQDGRVMITSSDAEAMKKAIEMVELIVKDVEAGEVYDGTVVRLEDFGAFVNLLPGKDGLVHVSEISWERTNKPSDALKMGDKVKVLVKEIDAMGRVNLSIRALTEKPEGYVERPPREKSDRGGRSSGRSGGGGYGRGREDRGGDRPRDERRRDK
jgi:polyribonucleotide nucleotidyltransferase